MERTHLFDLMGELKLYGMKAAFDEIMATVDGREQITSLGALALVAPEAARLVWK